MAKSTLDEIINLSKNYNTDWSPKLKSLGIFDHVKYLYEKYDKLSDAQIVLTYLFLCYDIDSPMVSPDKEWDVNKVFISKNIGIDLNKYLDAVSFQDSKVKDIAIYIFRARNERWDELVALKYKQRELRTNKNNDEKIKELESYLLKQEAKFIYAVEELDMVNVETYENRLVELKKRINVPV